MGRGKRLIKKLIFLFGGPKHIISYYRRQGVVLGERCEINKTAEIIAEPYLVTLGNDVRVAAGVKLITHDGGVMVARNMKEMRSQYNNIENADVFGNICIGNNVHIGVNAIILPNVTIGDNVIIGAGAVVTKDIPSNSVAVGVPAKRIKSIDEYVVSNKERFTYTKQLSYDEKKRILQGEKQ